jgi:hypothetical protein
MRQRVNNNVIVPYNKLKTKNSYKCSVKAAGYSVIQLVLRGTIGYDFKLNNNASVALNNEKEKISKEITLSIPNLISDNSSIVLINSDENI